MYSSQKAARTGKEHMNQRCQGASISQATRKSLSESRGRCTMPPQRNTNYVE